MLVGVSQDMAINLSRAPRQSVGGHGRKGSVEHAVSVLPPRAIQDPKAGCGEHGVRASVPRVSQDRRVVAASRRRSKYQRSSSTVAG